MVWEALLFLEGEVSTGNPDLGPPSEHQAYLRQLQYVLLLVFHLLTPISSLPCPALPLYLWLGFSQWEALAGTKVSFSFSPSPASGLGMVIAPHRC